MFIYTYFKRFETSAKSSIGIEDAAKALVGKILEDSKSSQPKNEEKTGGIKITKDAPKPQQQQEEGCGC